MEKFNSKIYKKYKNLKKKKLIDVEEWNNRSDSAITNFQSGVDELVEHWKNENDRLRAEIITLQDKYNESQRLNLEECRKTKVLSNEVERLSDEVSRLQNLLLQKNDHDNSVQKSPYTTPVLLLGSTKKCSSNKRKKHDSTGIQNESQSEEISIIPYEIQSQQLNVPDCCWNNKKNSGHAISVGELTCTYKSLMEYLVRMKFTMDLQNEGACLLAIHQRSGYSFTLTLSSDEDGGYGEILYRVKTLGTIERIALDWMKGEIVFSPTMLPKFFEKIEGVLG